MGGPPCRPPAASFVSLQILRDARHGRPTWHDVAVRVERPRRLAVLAGAVILLVAAGSVAAWSRREPGEADDPAESGPGGPGRAQRPHGRHRRGAHVLPGFAERRRRGAGQLGSRPSVGQEEMTLRQRIERTDGCSERFRCGRRSGTCVPPTTHWHVLGFMRYELRNADGVRLVRDRKTGFCLGDRYRVEQSLPGRAPSARYSDRCGRVRRAAADPGRNLGLGRRPPPPRARSSTSPASGGQVRDRIVNANRDSAKATTATTRPRSRSTSAGREDKVLRRGSTSSPAARWRPPVRNEPGSSGMEEASAPSRLADSGRGQQEEEHDVVSQQEARLSRTTLGLAVTAALFAAVPRRRTTRSPR